MPGYMVHFFLMRISFDPSEHGITMSSQSSPVEYMSPASVAVHYITRPTSRKYTTVQAEIEFFFGYKSCLYSCNFDEKIGCKSCSVECKELWFSRN